MGLAPSGCRASGHSCDGPDSWPLAGDGSLAEERHIVPELEQFARKSSRVFARRRRLLAGSARGDYARLQRRWSAMGFDGELQDWRTRALEFERALNGCVLGLAPAVRLLLIAILARGHVLLEGNVGVGKTTLLRAAARGLGGAYERVEGTIDLMPQDLVYHTFIDRDGKPRVDPGPLIAHGAALSVFFFNEINRARPQVHSLLLRAMAERSLTAFNNEYRFPHLQVFADRNRVEKEETFE